MANNLFVGEHSTVLVNFDNVDYAESEGPHGGNLTVYFKSGRLVVFRNGNADMFRAQWRDYAKPTPIQ